MMPAHQQSRRLAPGDKLGKYELIRQIAIGGMAELYLARTLGIEGFEKLVVVKRILPQYVTNASFVNMFLNEARLAATLHHPNVAQVYDIGVEDGDYFFAMEYVHGEDLERVASQSIEQGVPMSMDASLTLIAGLCAGLHYAHERTGTDGRPLQIVHRDVSPSNVLVSYDGGVKLVDFGIARAMTGKTNNSQGGLKGKIVYMSPEQCRSDAVLDRRSDIYSIGTLLYELTVGRTPFSGETEYAILNQIVNSDVPAPTVHVPGYPPALQKIVLRALAREPAERYATAIQLQGELEDFAHESRLRVSPLVLARLMSSLFPARLEEWDNAKSQGAFFVEQHVVRTLIEDSRSESTAIGPPPPVAAIPRVARTLTPVALGAASAGTLVSSSQLAGEPVARETPGHLDVTERVRLPSPTRLVRTKHSRGAVIALASIVAIGGGAAAYVATRDDAPALAPVESKAAIVTPPPAPPPPPAPAAKAPEVTPPTPPELPPPAPPEPEAVKVEPAAKSHHVHVPPKPHSKAEVKPAAKPEPPKPEEKPWNADSPFMPVRTDKH